jgi:hypothetical protein
MTTRYEVDADGHCDAVLVDAWGTVVARAFGADRDDAAANLAAMVARSAEIARQTDENDAY